MSGSLGTVTHSSNSSVGSAKSGGSDGNVKIAKVAGLGKRGGRQSQREALIHRERGDAAVHCGWEDTAAPHAMMPVDLREEGKEVDPPAHVNAAATSPFHQSSLATAAVCPVPAAHNSSLRPWIPETGSGASGNGNGGVAAAAAVSASSIPLHPFHSSSWEIEPCISVHEPAGSSSNCSSTTTHAHETHSRGIITHTHANNIHPQSQSRAWPWAWAHRGAWLSPWALPWSLPADAVRWYQQSVVDLGSTLGLDWHPGGHMRGIGAGGLAGGRARGWVVRGRGNGAAGGRLLRRLRQAWRRGLGRWGWWGWHAESSLDGSINSGTTNHGTTTGSACSSSNSSSGSTRSRGSGRSSGSSSSFIIVSGNSGGGGGGGEGGGVEGEGRSGGGRRKQQWMVPGLGLPLTADIVAIALVYFVQGVLGLARLAVSFFLKDEFGLDPAEVRMCSYSASVWALNTAMAHQASLRLPQVGHATGPAPCHGPCAMPRALRHATCAMPPAPCHLRHATCAMPPAPCHLRHATCAMPPAPCHLRLAICAMPPAPCHLRHATCAMPPAPCHLRHATCACHLRHATCAMPPAPCHVRHATCAMPHHHSSFIHPPLANTPFLFSSFAPFLFSSVAPFFLSSITSSFPLIASPPPSPSNPHLATPPPLFGSRRRSYLILCGFVGASAWALLATLVHDNDGFPLFGSRRRSYLILCGFVGASAWALLATIVHDKYSTVAMILLSSLSVAVSDVVVDSLVVERARGEDQSMAGSLQSLCWGSSAVGGIVSAYWSGSLVEMYGTRFVFAVTAVLPLITSIAGIFTLGHMSQSERVGEGRVGMGGLDGGRDIGEAVKERGGGGSRGSTDGGAVGMAMDVRAQALYLWATIRQPSILMPTLFIFLWQITPSSDTAMFFFTTNKLGFGPEFLGRVRLVTSVASLVGVGVYNFWLKHVPLQRIFLWSNLLGTALGCTQLLLVTGVNRTLGISDHYFALGDSLILTVLGQVSFMPILVLAARLCPPGIEATLFAALMSVNNGAYVLSGLLGAALTEMLGVTSTNFHNLALLVLLCNLSSLLALPFLRLLPSLEEVEAAVARLQEDIEAGKEA
ncbi:unnamed protein product [Closterium sp. NIES-64]|nr:unnamed protein product [Closterium sp. NIES-64]